MTNNTHPSNLKVRRLTELPQIPQEEIGESVLYATANNKDYKVGTTTYVDAVVEQLGDELAGIGEVRDEAVEARNDAVVASGAAAASAIEAASYATAAEQHAEDSESYASAAEESANLAEQARLSGPPVGYATRAEMEGNTSEDEGALALVTNDPIPDNNGTWRWSGTAWVQSADRVTGLEGEFRSATTALDVSATTGNFAMTLAEAIAAVPASLRKTRFIVRFNRGEEFQFLSANVADWTNISKWLRPVNALAEGAWNLVDDRMIYRGFCFPMSNAPAFHPDNAVLIVPIHRFYDGATLLPLTITVPGLVNLGISGSGFLSSTLGGVATRGPYGFDAVAIPATAAYAYINLSYNNGTTTVGAGQADWAASVARYARKGYESLRTDELNRGESVPLTNSRVGSTIRQVADGSRVLVPDNAAFYTPASMVNGSYVWEIFPEVLIQEGKLPLISRATGEPRRLFVSLLTSHAGGVTLRMKLERFDEAGIFDETNPFMVTRPGGGEPDPVFLNNPKLHLTGSFPDQTTVRMTLIPPKMGLLVSSAGFYGEDKLAISPEFIKQSRSAPYPYSSDYLYSFEPCEARFTSNYTFHPPASVAVSREVFNGMKLYSVTGTGAIHQQACLVGDKESKIEGPKTLNVFAERIGGSTEPAIDVIRDKSSDRHIDSRVLGITEGQWIHPDICYCGEAGVGGYKYWMVNSVYPYALPAREDAELLVSNDGKSWERIRSAGEDYAGPVSLRLPAIHWPTDAYQANTFAPIPALGTAMEFHTAAGVATQTIQSRLNHDPAILFHGGYVNVYVSYNFGLNETDMRHRYVVCYRTANGTDWQIVREDGSTMPYNAANAVRVFSSDGGVRNHVRYIHTPGATVGGRDTSPSIVKVSDSEFYWYASSEDYTPASGVKFGLVRYPGTSPYSFNWSNPQGTTLNVTPYGRVWHTCVRYYGGTFYVMYDGNMATSTDGLAFTNPAAPFFWRGGQADLYKPAFVVGGDGKVKIAHSVQLHLAYPTPFIAQVNPGGLTRFENNRVITQTLVCEFDSLTDIVTRGGSIRSDAYADVYLFLTNERNQNTRIMFFPGIRGQFKFKPIEFLRGDTIHSKVFLNTRGSGQIRFSGMIFDERA